MSFALKFPVPRVDQIGAEERAAKFTKRSIKNEAKTQGLKMAVAMMDLTTLEGADSKGKVVHLCRKARQPMLANYDCPPCAAVCVYPNQVAHAVKELRGSGIPVASVATGFPSGQYPLKLRLADVKDAVNSGAAEIDMVISRGTFLEGGLAEVFDEIAAVKEACGKAHLKVIFETGELQTYDNVRLISQLAIEAGADFIKTSTGKVSPAATLPVTLVMVETVRDHYLATGKKIGVKPAGGIRTAKQALQYLVMVKETVGNDWLTPDLFRFGASSLLGDVELQLAKLVDGNYQSADYFSKG
ncbi:MAG: deoxyribose-phosphate aldolase [Verrucomicrobiales bacterium]